METIYTILITLGVVALLVVIWGVIRLSRRVTDLELVRMEMIDLEGRFDKELESEIRDREQLAEFTTNRFVENNKTIDRRIDKLWEEYHNLNDRVKTLNKTINPNLELLK